MPGGIETTEELWQELMRTTHRIRRAIGHLLEPYDLRGPAAKVLRFLVGCGSEGVRLSDVSEELDVSPPHITRLIDDMEAKGLVQRRPDPDDRRALRVVVTEAGVELEARVRPLMADFSRQLLSVLGVSEQKQLRAYLQRLAERADELHHQYHNDTT